MTPAFGLTRKQRDLLLVVQELTALDGVPPTYPEIARELDVVSSSEVNRLLRLLRERGYVDWLPARARSLVVLRPIEMPAEPAIELTAAGIAAAAGIVAS